ncbi:penicillin-binding transpeptidase domain-containing protein [Streptomyces roseicoloratus]|uniref:Penicillin-binding transpeptidase domain-containing protein n=1 Tax=Streptomyces roseicoloratus TaxID=2508722 RepID=A0ABY9RYQ1_9ACTN|nr:penicillin-binding transpeptidase domain-containing protein [Streptomyces roseicoloratus]WMX46621.1 penicillin-binding transpeptidase domain-containing protein [Streptomyces roseicoloratus]
MRSGAKVAIVGGAFVVVASGVGYGGYNLWSGITGGSGGAVGTSGSESRKTGPVTSEEVTSTAKDFLAAWATGESDRAAQLTNNPVEAGPALLGFREEAKVSAVTITPGAPTGSGSVPFTVKATVTHDGVSKPWTYASELTVVRGLTTGRPLVDWEPAVLHPKLTTKTATLRTGGAKTGEIQAVDRKGRVLTAEKYPSLGPVLAQLRDRYGSTTGGKPGVEVYVDSGEQGVPDTTLLTLAKGEPGRLQTTIDADVQAAAEKAVARYGTASVVAIQPSTGAVRAVANSPANGFNTAFQGKKMPGSTMKIVTAALLLEKGLVKADAVTDCPSEAMYNGRTIRNLDDFSLQGKTFGYAFAMSCNTAFIKKIDDVEDIEGDDFGLAREAREVFGIGLDWKTGIVSEDGSVPEASGAAAAEQYIGQGTVTMNPLNVASITATAKAGEFKQPYLVAADVDNRAFAKAERKLPAQVAKQLGEMMRTTATARYGTATDAMASVGGDKGAKTGSAEVDGQGVSDSWFTGFSDDLAAAAFVQGAGHGATAAGPVVAQVLRAG